MVMSPLSEFYGRRPIYIASYTFFLIWLIPCAVARNIETMLVARFFDGLAGSAFLSVAGGTVGDLFPKAQLSLPMAFYTAAPFVGRKYALPAHSIFMLTVVQPKSDLSLEASSTTTQTGDGPFTSYSSGQEECWQPSSFSCQKHTILSCCAKRPLSSEKTRVTRPGEHRSRT